MLPQDLFTLFQNSSEVRVVSDNAKCIFNHRRPNSFQAARRTRSHERLEMAHPQAEAQEKPFSSNGISLPKRGNFRWDPEASFTDDAEHYAKNIPSRIGGEPDDDNPGGSLLEERKRSSMGLSLPVRRNSTDSIDAATLAEIFGDLDMLDSDEEDDAEDDDSSVSSSSIETSTSSTVSSSSLDAAREALR